MQIYKIKGGSIISKKFNNEVLLGQGNYFSQKIRERRKNMGLSMEKAAEFLDISVSYIGLLERGDRTPSLELFIKMCNFYKISIDDFFTNNQTISENSYDKEELVLLLYFNTLNLRNKETIINVIEVLNENFNNDTTHKLESKGNHNINLV